MFGKQQILATLRQHPFLTEKEVYAANGVGGVKYPFIDLERSGQVVSYAREGRKVYALPAQEPLSGLVRTGVPNTCKPSQGRGIDHSREILLELGRVSYPVLPKPRTWTREKQLACMRRNYEKNREKRLAYWKKPENRERAKLHKAIRRCTFGRNSTIL